MCDEGPERDDRGARPRPSFEVTGPGTPSTRRVSTQFFETTGYDSDIAAFKAVVPDAQDCKAWFAAKGAWANGQKFGEESSSWF